jgi:hypothetical protein
MFTVLSGQTTTLPFRVVAEDPSSPSYKLFSTSSDQHSDHEFRPGEKWSLLCTLNIADKNQLEQVSVALSRRFTWIRISAPTDLDTFIVNVLAKLGYLNSSIEKTHFNFIAGVWSIINSYRELGAAPFIDLIRMLKNARPEIDFLQRVPASDFRFLVSAINSSVTPLLDGLSLSEMTECASKISDVIGFDIDDKNLLIHSMSEFSF